MGPLAIPPVGFGSAGTGQSPPPPKKRHKNMTEIGICEVDGKFSFFMHKSWLSIDPRCGNIQFRRGFGIWKIVKF